MKTADRSISTHTFSYWRAKLGAPSEDPSGWLSIPTEPAAAINSLHVRVGSATVEVFAGFDPRLLRDVVSTLAQR